MTTLIAPKLNLNGNGNGAPRSDVMGRKPEAAKRVFGRGWKLLTVDNDNNEILYQTYKITGTEITLAKVLLPVPPSEKREGKVDPNRRIGIYKVGKNGKPDLDQFLCYDDFSGWEKDSQFGGTWVSGNWCGSQVTFNAPKGGKTESGNVKFTEFQPQHRKDLPADVPGTVTPDTKPSAEEEEPVVNGVGKIPF